MLLKRKTSLEAKENNGQDDFTAIIYQPKTAPIPQETLSFLIL